MSLTIKTITITEFSQNARILVGAASDNCVMIDPGGEAELLYQVLKDQAPKSIEIWLTHSHIDHIGAVTPIIEFAKKDGLEGSLIYGHSSEKEFRQNVTQVALMYGLSPEDFANAPEPNVELVDNGILEFSDTDFRCLFTPGHSPGHFGFYCDTGDFLLEEINHQRKVVRQKKHLGPLLVGGDALFHNSIGRTDLPGGNHAQLINSIKTKLFCLPDETLVLSGHGPNTTIGFEKKHNPFLT
jgi:glyoxylase-like metal-dependent hydrolase (beta-lactamase superfamily II)